MKPMNDLVFLEPNRLDAEPFTTSEVIVEPNQQVYVIERGNNDVKIGVSTKFSQRRRAIETQAGFIATRYFAGEKLSNGFIVEHAVHSKLSEYRKVGEWFSVPFEDAVSTVIAMSIEMGKTDTIVYNLPQFWDKLPTAMEDLEEINPTLYQWCVKNGYEVRYTEYGVYVYGDFGDGFCTEMNFDLFRAVTHAIWDWRLC